MPLDHTDIQKLTERVEALEKFKEEVRGRYIFWLVGLSLLMMFLNGYMAAKGR